MINYYTALQGRFQGKSKEHHKKDIQLNYQPKMYRPKLLHVNYFTDKYFSRFHIGFHSRHTLEYLINRGGGENYPARVRNGLM